MADSNSVIHLTVGSPITVPMPLDALRSAISNDLVPDAPPFLHVTDVQGRTYLINVNEIVTLRAWSSQLKSIWSSRRSWLRARDWGIGGKRLSCRDSSYRDVRPMGPCESSSSRGQN